MTAADAAEVVRDGLLTLAAATGPTLAAALVVGFAASLLQALTQLQDGVLAFAPKLAATLIAALLSLPAAGAALGGYMARLAERIAQGG